MGGSSVCEKVPSLGSVCHSISAIDEPSRIRGGSTKKGLLSEKSGFSSEPFFLDMPNRVQCLSSNLCVRRFAIRDRL